MKRRHTEEFKRQAVELANSLSNTRKAAEQLGNSRTQFEAVQEQWAKAIPENVAKPEVQALLLHDQGQNYYLDRGFVSESMPPLAESQAKKLAAIRYLVEHDLVFWSYNAGASGIEMGIYPRTGPVSVNPHMLWLTGYDFGDDIFQSMEKAGLEYSNVQWAPKAN